MNESNHFRRDLSARCLSHPLVENSSALSKSTHPVTTCRNCGIAFSNSAGFFLRPSRFEAVYNAPAPHSSLLRNMILRQRMNRPLTTEHINPILRLETVKWLQNLSIQLGLQKSTFARAVALMDKFLSTAPLDSLDYNIVMIITLNLACKFGERETNTFTVSQIATHLSDAYDKEEVARWEIDIVSALEWKLDVQTAHDFANHFLWQGAVTAQDLEQITSQKDTDPQRLLDCLDELVTKILDLTLVDFRFYRFTPVGLAASALALARGLMGLSPWTPDIQDVTTFSIDSLRGCLDVLQQLARTEGVSTLLQKILTRYQVGVVRPNPETDDVLLQGEKSASCSAISAALHDSSYGDQALIAPPLSLGGMPQGTPLASTVSFRNSTERKAQKTQRQGLLKPLGRTGPRHNKIRKERR